MRVFVTGGTGFIGQALVRRLRDSAHRVTLWSRSVARAREIFGDDQDVQVVPISRNDIELQKALAESDAIVNLAGESLLSGRWSPERREALVESRVLQTDRIVGQLALLGSAARPKVLVSGSAVGYYGDRGAEILNETARPGDDFLASLCRDWEAAASRAEPLGLRVVRLRTGVVLGRDGGALGKMLLPFRAGLGGPIGDGRQFISWVHIDDVVSLIVAALNDERYAGPINGTAPEPITNREFSRTLGNVLHRPAVLPVPAFLLKVALGEAASVLLASQRALPEKAISLGFVHKFVTIAAALTELLRHDPDAT